jgi:peptidoglycan/xylan/chitin deacetylase (PgdA/CDA1 family)
MRKSWELNELGAEVEKQPDNDTKTLIRRWGPLVGVLLGALAGALVVNALNSFSSGHRKSTPAARSGAAAAGKKAGSQQAALTRKSRVNCSVTKCIALTFDDGPIPGSMRLLDILKAKGARATFFVLGSEASTYPDVLRREVADGHEIGNHSFSHAKLAGAPAAKVNDEINRTQGIIKDATGKAPALLRPPYGATDKQLDAIAMRDRLSQILWSADPQDYMSRDPAAIEKRVVDSAQPGRIIILHDIRPTTVAAIPGILDKLSKKGYSFVTVSEIYGDKLAAGQKYPAFLGSPEAGLAPPAPIVTPSG